MSPGQSKKVSPVPRKKNRLDDMESFRGQLTQFKFILSISSLDTSSSAAASSGPERVIKSLSTSCLHWNSNINYICA